MAIEDGLDMNPRGDAEELQMVDDGCGLGDEYEDYVFDYGGGDRIESDSKEEELTVIDPSDESDWSSASGDRNFYANHEIDELLSGYFRFFGRKDMDMIYLYFLSNKKQDEVMSILGKSQPAVSYDVNRIRLQARFVKDLMSNIDDVLYFILDPESPLRTFDRELLLVFFYSTSITKTAKLMNMGSVTCRSRLKTIIKKIASVDPGICEIFQYVLSNLNKVKKLVPDENDSADAEE